MLNADLEVLCSMRIELALCAGNICANSGIYGNTKKISRSITPSLLRHGLRQPQSTASGIRYLAAKTCWSLVLSRSNSFNVLSGLYLLLSRTLTYPSTGPLSNGIESQKFEMILGESDLIRPCLGYKNMYFK